MDLSELGAGTCGVWTRRSALALITPAAVRTLLRDGSWQVLWPGIYADGGFVLDAHQRAYAAVLACGGGPRSNKERGPVRVAACGRTAARVWGLPLIDDDDPATGAQEHRIDDVHVLGGGRVRRGPTGVLRRHELAPGGFVRLASGLVVTSRMRTLVHCAGLLSHEALVCAVDDALHRGLVSQEQLVVAAARRRGEPSAPALRRAVALADGRSESPAETLARLLLLPVLPALEPQVRLIDSAARVIARFDLGDRTARFAVEADGKRGHAGTAMVAKDRARDRITGAHGWRTERVTWFELRRRGPEVVDRMLQAYAEHTARSPDQR
jgi:hypothetical protein